MAKVTGIGGVFFRSRDPSALTAWYVEHLGLPLDEDGYVVLWWGDGDKGSTVWAPFPEGTSAFGWPDSQQGMVNYRVDDLDGLLRRLEAAGTRIADQTFEDDNGRFAHCWDPEGNLLQLWEPAPGM